MTVTAGAGPVIRVRGLTKRYGDVQAVDCIDFDVAPGEIFGLLGPNGAGKTTTVEILEGLRQPDGGEVRVLGVDVTRRADELKPRIGVSLQTAALYPKLTVTELIDLFRSFYPRWVARRSPRCGCALRSSSRGWSSASRSRRPSSAGSKVPAGRRSSCVARRAATLNNEHPVSALVGRAALDRA